MIDFEKIARHQWLLTDIPGFQPLAGVCVRDLTDVPCHSRYDTINKRSLGLSPMAVSVEQRLNNAALHRQRYTHLVRNK